MRLPWQKSADRISKLQAEVTEDRKRADAVERRVQLIDAGLRRIRAELDQRQEEARSS